MIDITDTNERCFAYMIDECALMEHMPMECNTSCPFYKPIGCREWVRINTKTKVWLLTPEEYEERFKNKKDKPPTWRITTKGVDKDVLE